MLRENKDMTHIALVVIAFLALIPGFYDSFIKDRSRCNQLDEICNNLQADINNLVLQRFEVSPTEIDKIDSLETILLIYNNDLIKNIQLKKELGCE